MKTKIGISKRNPPSNSTSKNPNKYAHLVSLNAKNARLLPLGVYRQRQEEFENALEDEDVPLGFYDIKINNEFNERIDYQHFNPFNTDKSYMSIPFDVSSSSSSSKQKMVTNTVSSASSSSIILSTESADTSLLSSSSPGSKSNSSISSNSPVQAAFAQCDVSQTVQQPIKVEYIPRGKIITINVSIMW